MENIKEIIKKRSIIRTYNGLKLKEEDRRLKDKMIRKVVKADSRQTWENILFHNNFGTPLKEDGEGVYKNALESLRWSSSPGNKQPWRVPKTSEGFHFFQNTSKFMDRMKWYISRINVGIAMWHFGLALEEEKRQEDGITIDLRKMSLLTSFLVI